jgi:alpha-methylacyl-CoA racemase
MPDSPQALDGIRVIDLSRQAPGPYCSMLLADFGADVVLVEPPGGSTRGETTNSWWELETDSAVSDFAALRRNKRSIVLDLKDDDDRDVMSDLVASADVLIEGFRPGVAKRLGIDSQTCLQRNPALVYCSLTGYGQTSESALRTGHDINYLAETGILSIFAGSDGKPVLPLNVVADFAGGGLLAAFAIMVALHHRERTGRGQSIDLAMVDGTFSLLTHAASLRFARNADLRPDRFFLSGLLPQYGVYRCKDERWVALGTLEPWFYAKLMQLTGREDLADSHRDPGAAAEVRAHLEQWFDARTSAEAGDLLADEDVCVNLVLTFQEALEVAEQRGMLPRPDGIPQIGIAPKLSHTPGAIRSRPPVPGRDGDEIRTELKLARELRGV